MGDICIELDVSERRLNRQFRDIVGIAPKYYARVVQMNIVIGMLMSNDKAALTELAHKCGYYDQSHFVKTMQQFFQQSPREFLNSDNCFCGREKKVSETFSFNLNPPWERRGFQREPENPAQDYSLQVSPTASRHQ